MSGLVDLETRDALAKELCDSMCHHEGEYHECIGKADRVLASGLVTITDEVVATLENLCRQPNGEREWHNQGRSGYTPVVDVDRIRAAIDRLSKGTP